MRQLNQNHWDLRAQRADRLVSVTDAAGVAHHRIEAGHQRALATVFGEVRVDRLAYRAPWQGNLHPADAVLNLPVEKHSHGLRRLAATEAARGAFDEARSALARTTGVATGKRQIEDLTVRSASDFSGFYATCRRPAPAPATELLVMQVDARAS